MRMIESKIQAEIVQFLQSKGLFFFSIPNEAAGKNYKIMPILKSMGLRSGVADLVVMLQGGNPLFLEVKSPKGKQSENQIFFEKKCIELGYKYRIARSINDVEKMLLISSKEE